jgi:uncharacterized membrane protein YgcG
MGAQETGRASSATGYLLIEGMVGFVFASEEKEAMAMRNDRHLLQRVGREFVKNAIWMVVVFGVLGAILVAATDLPMVGVMVFVGAFVAVMAAIMTGVALWSGAREDTSPGGGHSDPEFPRWLPRSGHSHPGSPPDRRDYPSDGWYGGGGPGGGGGGGG